jgi:cation diffusion facilitator CzcD-associated flavoprotein CzcO
MEHFDVLIIGAGLSGIAAGYHLQDKNPNKSYAILEMREAMGGTWDLFKYPGIRSDSDMYTLGYSFRPWTYEKSLADGPAILNYIRETAEEYGIDEKIRYQHKVVAAEWSSAEQQWTITVEHQGTGEELLFTCDFSFMCSGYYDYESGYTPDFEGYDDFEGQIIHPQKWEEGTDYEDKRIIVIGSGATAVTLVPALAEKAKEVIMLQRSPTYILSLPAIDPIAQNLQEKLPDQLAYHLIRWKNILVSMGLFQVSRRFPKFMRKLITEGVRNEVGETLDVDNHFNPWYNPWDQRMCLIPDSDLFDALNEGTAKMVTDHIERFTETGIQLQSGEHLEADIIVTATGLSLKFLAGVDFTVDCKEVKPSDVLPYKGVMLEGVPNMAMAFGYTNASWTLKCELACKYVSRMLNHMDDEGYSVVIPTVEKEQIDEQPLIDMNAGYFKRAEDQLPSQGSEAPWKVYQNYLKDIFSLKFQSVEGEGLKFLRPSDAQKKAVTPPRANRTEEFRKQA